MPTYNFRHKETDEVIEKFLTISAMETFLKENVEWEITFLECRIGDPVALGVKKPPSDFMKYVIDPIHKRRGTKQDLKYTSYNREL